MLQGGTLSECRMVHFPNAAAMEYDRSQPIIVELLDDQYTVTFPVDKSAPAGTRYRGPDYAARYWIDAKTGEVLRGLLGS